MAESNVQKQSELGALIGDRSGDPCIMVIFGASGDLTKRLLMPAMYNLACDRLLPDQFAIVGLALDDYTSDSFREKMSEDIKQFSTRKEFDPAAWDTLAERLHYTPGSFDDPEAFARLSKIVGELNEKYNAQGNILFYMATPPPVFGMISNNLEKAGFKTQGDGWKRIIVEKPFGNDLQSAIELNRELLTYWTEDQIYRIDHYLGKETVQNILSFRFANRIFEPLWNSNFVDHIQLTVTETVGVEGRGNYYERSGVLRDMIQNHMFQMLAYVCMESPASFQSDAIRDEKSKVLGAVRVMTPEEVLTDTVRGQYGPGRKVDGSDAVGYRAEADVNPKSATETFAAMKLHIDNWRWEGVPIYIRSGKALWKKETEIMVQFKQAPEVLFRDTPAVDHLESNQLVFHIQPDQGIELRFQAKNPGPSMSLQKVNMRFNYGESFTASRGTGYETLVYQCMIGDATLFSRTDLVETAWRIAQPMLDTWADTAPEDFPNYSAGSWGPKAAFDLIEKDGRKWMEILNRDIVGKVPLFNDCGNVFLHSLMMMLKPVVFSPGDTIIAQGDTGKEMYFVNRGNVEVVDDKGAVIKALEDGDFFGEMGLLLSRPRTATVRAKTDCDLFVLEKSDFSRVLRDHPQFARSVLEAARERYEVYMPAADVFDSEIARYLDAG